MNERKYYQAYDDRYRQVHEKELRWFAKNPTPIVGEMIRAFSIPKEHRLLEIGCGEGRDAIPLLRDGYDLLATDVSEEAIAYCRAQAEGFEQCFATFDCVTETLSQAFDFIYAVAVVHMLVLDEDRNAFYQCLHRHLKKDGIALVCSMGDGEVERQSDVRTAFSLQDRIHEATGTPLQIASTSCRMVTFPTFREEIRRNGLSILKEGITTALPDFSQMMYAVVRKA